MRARDTIPRAAMPKGSDDRSTCGAYPDGSSMSAAILSVDMMPNAGTQKLPAVLRPLSSKGRSCASSVKLQSWHIQDVAPSISKQRWACGDRLER